MQQFPEGPIATILQWHARQSANVPAVIPSDGAPLTYKNLWDQTVQIGTALKACNITPGDRVAAALPNGPDMAVLTLGVACYTALAPLNPAYTAEEFKTYMPKLGVRLLVVPAGEAEAATEAASTLGIPVLQLAPREHRAVGTMSFTGPEKPSQPAGTFAGETDTVLVLHTSGSTGLPKVVPLTQANLLASARNMADWLKLGPGDRCLNIMPSFHIHGLMAGTIVPILCGGSTVCPASWNGDVFFEMLRDFRPTYYSAVPTMHQLILASAPHYRDVIDLRTLRFIRSSSAPLPAQILEALENTFDAPVLEALSMTEACHQVCCNPLPPAERRPGTVGKPAGVSVAILDENGMALDDGTVGEIAIRGANVIAKYEHNPPANRESFVNGWFRTGDQGYFDDAGYLVLTGRLKELINRGGEKIAPLEIDNCLLDHPAVTAALSCPISHPSLGEEVAAAVVLREGVRVTERELQSHAMTRLAVHKIPRKILFLDDLPKGPTGKPDRSGLRRIIEAGAAEPDPSRATEPVTPISALERQVRQVWCDVLGKDDIGPSDDFFLLGGDSLQAIRLNLALKESFEVDLPQDAVLVDGATVAGMAEIIADLRGQARAQEKADMGPEPIAHGTAVAVSVGQRSHAILDAVHRGLPTWNTAGALRFRGTLDRGALENAIREIEARHEALRTTLGQRDDGLQQIIGEPGSLTATEHRIAAGETLDDRLRTSVQVPFELFGGALVRADLFPVDRDDHVLLMAMHHAITDGWSRHLLLGEISTLYADFAADRPSSLPEPGLQFADFSLWQNGRFEAGEFRRDLEFWKAQLAGGPRPLRLPMDRPLPDRATWHAETVAFEVTAPEKQQLQNLARGEKASLFMILLAGFEALAGCVLELEDIVVLAPFSNRLTPRTQSVAGFLMNSIPLRTPFDASTSFTAFLGRIRATVAAGFAHQATPLEYVRQELGSAWRETVGGALPVMFQYRDYETIDPVKQNGMSIEPYRFDTGIVPAELSVEWTPTAGGLCCAFVFQTELFDRATIEELAGAYRALLSAVVTAPDAPLQQLWNQ